MGWDCAAGGLAPGLPETPPLALQAQSVSHGGPKPLQSRSVASLSLPPRSAGPLPWTEGLGSPGSVSRVLRPSRTLGQPRGHAATLGLGQVSALLHSHPEGPALMPPWSEGVRPGAGLGLSGVQSWHPEPPSC